MSGSTGACYLQKEGILQRRLSKHTTFCRLFSFMSSHIHPVICFVKCLAFSIPREEARQMDLPFLKSGQGEMVHFQGFR